MKSKSLIFKLITLAAVIYGMFTITEGIMTLTKFTTFANVGMGIGVAYMSLILGILYILMSLLMRALKKKFVK